MPLSKPWYTSKTIWINILTVVVGVAGVIGGSDLIAEYPGIAAAIATGIAVINIVLRAITDRPVALK